MESLHRELKFRVARSGGSGGQHVNKVSTKVELLFDVLKSQALTDEQKALVLERLANRITQDGILQIASEASRSQLQNKTAAIKKFDQLIFKALAPVKNRAEVVTYTANKRKRLAERSEPRKRKPSAERSSSEREMTFLFLRNSENFPLLNRVYMKILR